METARAGASGSVRVGTSGYSFKDWVGSFYPAGMKPADHLAFYAQHFDCVEVNVTYYRVPDAKLLDGMLQRTPDGFDFILKLHGDMTHKRSRDPALYREFTAALAPLADAGRLQGLLAQFPYGFKNTQENRAFLAELRQTLQPHALFTEFRHESWVAEPVFCWLRNLQLGWVCVDEPPLPGLVPPIVRATTDRGYVRFHGRNSKTWFDAGPDTGDRYDYLYSEAELREWVTRIRQLVQETRTTYVFFNNCHAGQAPANAQALKELLASFCEL